MATWTSAANSVAVYRIEAATITLLMSDGLASKVPQGEVLELNRAFRSVRSPAYCVRTVRAVISGPGGHRSPPQRQIPDRSQDANGESSPRKCRRPEGIESKQGVQRNPTRTGEGQRRSNRGIEQR